MKASVEEINKVQRRIKIELTSADVQSSFDKAYRQIQKKANVKGFRPGKAPMNMIKKMYGQSVAYDIFDDLVRHHLPQALEKEQLRPVAPPVVETTDKMPAEGQDYGFSAIIDIMPEIKLGSYKGLELNYKSAPVSDEMINRELEILQYKNSKRKDLDAGTAAQDQHFAIISHRVFENGTELEDLASKELPVIIGKKELYPDLEAALLGMKAGEIKTVDITLKDDFQDPQLAGKQLQFEITMNSLAELVLPQLDDEFAKDIGVESFAKLREGVQENLQRQAEQERRNQLEVQLLGQLTAANPFDVPPSIVDQVIDSMIDEVRWPNDIERKKAHQDQELRQRFLENAKVKARNTLALLEVIKSESLKVTDDDVDSYAKSVSGMKPEDVTPQMLQAIKRQLGPQVKENLLFNKALDLIIDNANIKEA